MLNTGFLSGQTTSAAWKGDESVSEMTISAAKVKKPPKYDAAAAELLERCRMFYEDPENERAFREWKAGKEAKK